MIVIYLSITQKWFKSILKLYDYALFQTKFIIIKCGISHIQYHWLLFNGLKVIPLFSSYSGIPIDSVEIFNLIFPAAISLCLLWLRSFLAFNFLSFLLFFFWCMTRRIWQTTAAPTQTNPGHRYTLYLLLPGYSHVTQWANARAAHLSRVFLRAEEIEVSKILTPSIVPYDGSGLRRNAYGRD